jgi:hypothetical protein
MPSILFFAGYISLFFPFYIIHRLLISRVRFVPLDYKEHPDYKTALLKNEPSFARLSGRFWCPYCRQMRQPRHDCRSLGKIRPSKSSNYGDLIHHLHISQLTLQVDEIFVQTYTSGAAQAAYLIKFCPELVPSPEPNGTPPSVHRISTVFEEHYALDLHFRIKYRDNVFPYTNFPVTLFLQDVYCDTGFSPAHSARPTAVVAHSSTQTPTMD